MVIYDNHQWFILGLNLKSISQDVNRFHIEDSIHVYMFVCFEFHCAGPQTLVSSDHHSKLPYTDAFLHEVLRMKPNAPIGMPRVTLCDTSVGKYQK